MKKSWVLILILFVFLKTISGMYVEDKETITNMGHALRIKNISLNPQTLEPGESGILNIEFINNAGIYLDDLIFKLELPSEFKFNNDVNKVKISRINPLESKNISFKIIALPDSDLGIYNANLVVDYISYMGVNEINVGEKKQDNYTFSLKIKKDPEFFVNFFPIKNDVLKIRVVNNGVSNMKFVSVRLKNSKNYRIISPVKEYIGDLDSDDYDSVSFDIIPLNKNSLEVGVEVYYEDEFNNKYIKEFKKQVEILKEKKDNTLYWILGLIMSVFLIYFLLKRKKIHKNL